MRKRAITAIFQGAVDGLLSGGLPLNFLDGAGALRIVIMPQSGWGRDGATRDRRSTLDQKPHLITAVCQRLAARPANRLLLAASPSAGRTGERTPLICQRVRFTGQPLPDVEIVEIESVVLLCSAIGYLYVINSAAEKSSGMLDE